MIHDETPYTITKADLFGDITGVVVVQSLSEVWDFSSSIRSDFEEGDGILVEEQIIDDDIEFDYIIRFIGKSSRLVLGRLFVKRQGGRKL